MAYCGAVEGSPGCVAANHDGRHPILTAPMAPARRSSSSGEAPQGGEGHREAPRSTPAGRCGRGDGVDCGTGGGGLRTPRMRTGPEGHDGATRCRTDEPAQQSPPPGGAWYGSPVVGS